MLKGRKEDNQVNEEEVVKTEPKARRGNKLTLAQQVRFPLSLIGGIIPEK